MIPPENGSMAELVADTPLLGRELGGDGFQLRENTRWDLVRLQIFHRDPGQLRAFAERIGRSMPENGEVGGDNDTVVFPGAPGEWILGVEPGQAADTIRQLGDKLHGLLVVTEDVTDSRVTMELSGRSLRRVLARGSSLDFDTTVFTVGRCATTRFAGVSVTLATPDDEDSDRFVLFACRSHGDYLYRWFEEASKDVR